MAFFEKLGETISSKSKEVAAKAKEMADVAGLNSSIATEEGNIKKNYLEIGTKYYEWKKDAPDPELRELVEAINASNRAIEGFRKEIQKIKGTRKCVSCGVEIGETTLFCGACGARNDLTVLEEEPVPEAAASPPGEERKCSACGAVVEGAGEFCTGCGAKLS